MTNALTTIVSLKPKRSRCFSMGHARCSSFNSSWTRIDASCSTTYGASIVFAASIAGSAHYTLHTYLNDDFEAICIDDVAQSKRLVCHTRRFIMGLHVSRHPEFYTVFDEQVERVMGVAGHA